MMLGLRNAIPRWTKKGSGRKAFALVAVSVLLCAGIAGCTADTGPGAFALSSPTNGATDVSLDPTLTWTSATGAADYTVEVANESTFSPPLVYENTGISAEATSAMVPDSVLAGGATYYWRVIANSSSGSTIAANAPFSFAVRISASLVPGFGTGGVVTSNPSTGDDAAGDIAIDSTAMYVVGFDESTGLSLDKEWRIEKRALTDGSLVPGFGIGGVIISNNSTGDDAALAIAIDSTAMYVVGLDESPGNQEWRIEKRSLADGSLVPGFGIGGVITSNNSTGDDAALAIAIDSTAMYVVGFDESTGLSRDREWRIEKRSLADGSLVSGFGIGGVVTSNNSTTDDTARGIAVDSAAMYVIGWDENSGLTDQEWRIEKRSLTDGSLVQGFGTGGVVTSNPSTGDDAARAIAIDSTAMYVVGDEGPGYYGDWAWRIEKRSLTDGSLVQEFGTGGVVTRNYSTGDDAAVAVTIDSTALYVVGIDSAVPGPGPSGDAKWRIEKRGLIDGSLVEEFGTGGVVTSNPSAGFDAPSSITIDSATMYVVGVDNSPGNLQWRIEKRVK
jgi:hypothetical protein